MNAQQHIPVDDLAAYAASDLDATTAVAVEAHLVLCAQCRSDVEAITAATAALTGVDRPVMPTDVAARIDAALAAERVAPGADIVPLAPRRRRPSLAGIAAVAAAVALVAAIGVPFVTRGSSHKANTTAAPAKAVVTRRLSSNLDYTHTTLAATLRRALTGTSADNYAAGAGSGPQAPVPTVTPQERSGAATWTSGKFTADQTTDLYTNPARLAACLTSLATGLPAQAQTPVVVDFARFAGKPAVVVGFETVSEGQVRTDKLDVFVVGPRCGVTPGDDDVLDFARIPRP